MAAKMSQEELAEIWDFDPERIKEYEKQNIKMLGGRKFLILAWLGVWSLRWL
jgi:hypothetical protein